jgi:hypothetical protein
VKLFVDAFRPIWIGFASAVFSALVAVGIYAWTTTGGWPVLAGAALIGGAALVSAAIIGFLFGVPRALTMPAPVAPDATASSTAPNTNLEQVSDWLTKVLLGATLTQLGNIGNAASHLFVVEAPALGGGRSAAVMAGAVSVYMAGVGFLFGWLMTRLFLGKVMDLVDQAHKLDQAADLFEKASITNDVATADAYRSQALASVQSIRRSFGANPDPSAGTSPPDPAVKLKGD